MIKKVLIANRGEIAVRVIRAAREMGIRTVAVYSEADEHAMHASLADEAIEIGEPEASKSYLNMERILDATKRSGADAIHPGYGFLSERAEFADACQSVGIQFIGPPASAMRTLGSKIAAKKMAREAGVPLTPGFFEPKATPDQLHRAALEIGYPVMLKASAGGGGRGMRVVVRDEDFLQELSIASDEALKGFGDGAMMVEKLVHRPRHIEVQVLADSNGNVAPLFERECSIQRRHQKIVEEASATSDMSELWPKMRDSAVSLAKAARYIGAGTFEFMVDEAAGEYYFLEVNARLQVEHPVTEAVTGLDLVHWQLRIASGESLDSLSLPLLNGDRTALRGHAIEARIVAEDPGHNFLPSVGKIVGWAEPKAPGIRVDTGYGPGSEVTRHYDSLLAKVIAHAATRTEAIQRLKCALQDFHVLGIKTNIGYLINLLSHPDFVAGNIDTGFLGRNFENWQPSTEVPLELGALVARAKSSSAEAPAPGQASAPAWGAMDDWRVIRTV